MTDQSANWWQSAPLAPTGDDFLKTLPADRASMVKAMSEGRMKLPSVNRRSPMASQLLSDLAQYDPTFDTANADARVATRKAFTSGKQGQNISSFNTALGHLGTLAQRAEDLNNGHFPLLNSIENTAEAAFGDPRKSNFNIAKTAVVDELTRAFRGTGGNVHDLEQWEANISSAQSPAQLRGAIQQAAQLLQSRVQAMGDSYNAGMGTTDQPLPLLNAHANDALARFQSKDYLDKGYSAVGLPGANSDNNQPPVVGVPGNGGPPGGGGSPPPAGPMDGPSSTPTVITSGKTHEEVDPKASALIDQMIYSGAKADDINAALAKQFGQGTFGALDQAQVDAAQSYLKAHPTYKGGFGRAVKTVDSSLTQRIGGSAPVAAGAGAVDALSFGALPKAAAGVSAVGDRLTGDNRSIGDIYDANLATANATRDQIQDAHPLAYLGGNVAGFLAGEGAIKKIGEKVVEKVPGAGKLFARNPGTLKPIAADAAYGGAYGLGSSDSLADVPGNVLTGVALSAGGGVLGRGTVKTLANIASPVASGAAKRLTDAGVTLTPGQILGDRGGFVGKAAKGIEDRLAGFPVIGDVINSTRRQGVEDFNHAAINDALAPIDESLPQGHAHSGHDAIAYAQTAVSNAYDQALSGMSAVPDAAFNADLRAVGKAAKGLSQDHRAAFNNILDTNVQPYFSGKKALDGADLQAIKQGLDKEIADYSAGNASPQDKKLAERLGDVRNAILGLAGRSDPASAGAFKKANEAFALLSRVQDAAAKSKDGVFTPNQFRQAVTKRGYGTTTAKVARGDAPMQALSTDASMVLPNAVPDSGTAGRVALAAATHATGGALLGAGEGYREGGLAGAVPGALLGGALFSRPGAKAIQYALAGSRGKKLNTLGDYLRRHSLAGGEVAAPLLLQNLRSEAQAVTIAPLSAKARKRLSCMSPHSAEAQ
jgi:hypothetical protein